MCDQCSGDYQPKLNSGDSEVFERLVICDEERRCKVSRKLATIAAYDDGIIYEENWALRRLALGFGSLCTKFAVDPSQDCAISGCIFEDVPDFTIYGLSEKDIETK